MLVDDGNLFTDQLFQCYKAIDRKQFEYAELLIWLIQDDLRDKLEDLENMIRYHSEPRTEKRSIIESAFHCTSKRLDIINHIMEDLEEHR